MTEHEHLDIIELLETLPTEIAEAVFLQLKSDRTTETPVPVQGIDREGVMR